MTITESEESESEMSALSVDEKLDGDPFLLNKFYTEPTLFVGWECCGAYKASNEPPNVTRSLSDYIRGVESNLVDASEAINEFGKRIKANDIKRLVFVHYDFPIDKCLTFIDMVHLHGVKHVNLRHWVANALQKFIFKHDVKFTSGQYFLFSVKGKAEYSQLWRFVDNQVIFQRKLPVFSPATLTAKNNAFVNILRPLVKKFDIWLFLNDGCQKTSSLTEKEFPSRKVIKTYTLKNDIDYISTAEWTAQYLHDPKNEVLVSNIALDPLSLTVDGHLLLDNVCAGVPLPYSWKSKLLVFGKPCTAKLNFGTLETEIILPAFRHCRIQVSLDDNGRPSISCNDKPLLSMSLHHDSFYLTWSSSSEFGTLKHSKRYSTALKCDCDPPEITEPSASPNVLTDAIVMLDPAFAKGNWYSMEDQHGLFIQIEGADGRQKGIQASTVVKKFLIAARAICDDDAIDDEVPMFLAIPSSFTQAQRQGLDNVAASTGVKIIAVDEMMALASGFAMEKAFCPTNCLLIISLSNQGCATSFFKYNGFGMRVIRQEENSEVTISTLTDAIKQCAIESKDHSNNNKSKSSTNVCEALSDFKAVLIDILGDDCLNVKSVILLGDYKPSLLLTLVQFACLHAELITMDDAEMRRVASVGATVAKQSLKPVSSFNLL